MWGMFINSFQLFCKGRLFREPRAVLRQWSVGFVISLAVLVVPAKMGLPLWLAITVAALVGGGLQPFLFKNLKYA